MIKKLLGSISVDSGTVFIGDPCYLRDEINPDDISAAMNKGWREEKNYAPINFKLGHDGAGIVTTTFHGDGVYPVYGFFHDGDDRPYQIIIEFNEEPVNQDDNV